MVTLVRCLAWLTCTLVALPSRSHEDCPLTTDKSGLCRQPHQRCWLCLGCIFLTMVVWLGHFVFQLVWKPHSSLMINPKPLWNHPGSWQEIRKGNCEQGHWYRKSHRCHKILCESSVPGSSDYCSTSWACLALRLCVQSYKQWVSLE